MLLSGGGLGVFITTDGWGVDTSVPCSDTPDSLIEGSGVVTLLGGVWEPGGVATGVVIGVFTSDTCQAFNMIWTLGRGRVWLEYFRIRNKQTNNWITTTTTTTTNNTEQNSSHLLRVNTITRSEFAANETTRVLSEKRIHQNATSESLWFSTSRHLQCTVFKLGSVKSGLDILITNSWEVCHCFCLWSCPQIVLTLLSCHCRFCYSCYLPTCIEFRVQGIAGFKMATRNHGPVQRIELFINSPWGNNVLPSRH